MKMPNRSFVTHIRVHLSGLRHSGTRDNEFRIKPDGGYRWFRSKVRIFKTERSQVKQIIGLAEDVTYEKRLHEKLANETGGRGMN
jgi:hypothetical protein